MNKSELQQIRDTLAASFPFKATAQNDAYQQGIAVRTALKLLDDAIAVPEPEDAPDKLDKIRTTLKIGMNIGRALQDGDETDNARDAARYRWALPILTGLDSETADSRALAIAFQLMRGLDGDAAISAAMEEKP